MKKYEELPLSRLSEDSLTEYSAHMGHEFSEETEQAIISNVQQKNQRVSWFDKIRYSRRNLTVAVALASLLIIPGTVYGASKLWQTYFSQHNYSSILSVSNNGEENATKYRLELSYLPENWQPYKHNDGEAPMKFGDLSQTGQSLSTLLIKIDERQQDFETLYTKDVENLELNGHQVWLISQQTSADSTETPKMAYVEFADEGYLLELYVGTTVTRAELEKIINGLNLVEAGAGPASYYTTGFAEETEGGVTTAGEQVEAENTWRIPVDSPVIKQVGEEQHFAVETIDGPQDFSVTVTQVATLDNLMDVDNFATDELLQERFSSLLEAGMADAEGNLLPFTETLYRKGNGKDSLDTIVSQKTEQLKFVKLNITFTNQSDQDYQDFYYGAQVAVLAEIDGYYQEKYPLSGDEEYSTPQGYTTGNLHEIMHSSIHGLGKAYYNIGDIPAHSAKTFEIGFLVPASDVADLFLNPETHTNQDEVQESMERVRLFDN